MPTRRLTGRERAAQASARTAVARALATPDPHRQTPTTSPGPHPPSCDNAPAKSANTSKPKADTGHPSPPTATPADRRPNVPDHTTTATGCPETVWDGPYSFRCGAGAGSGMCHLHGQFRTAPEHDSALPGSSLRAQDAVLTGGQCGTCWACRAQVYADPAARVVRAAVDWAGFPTTLGSTADALTTAVGELLAAPACVDLTVPAGSSSAPQETPPQDVDADVLAAWVERAIDAPRTIVGPRRGPHWPADSEHHTPAVETVVEYAARAVMAVVCDGGRLVCEVCDRVILPTEAVRPPLPGVGLWEHDGCPAEQEPTCCGQPMVRNNHSGQYECADAYFELLDDGVLSESVADRSDTGAMTDYQRERYAHWQTTRVPVDDEVAGPPLPETHDRPAVTVHIPGVS